jgi:hypothetical protein
MSRETSARQTQARALRWKEIRKFIGGAGEGIRADRERATDAEGQGRVAYPSRETVKWLKVWRGHSTRVGAAQDLAELDIDLAAITQAGGWKSPRMQYAEKINAARSGMARAAAATGRDLR